MPAPVLERGTFRPPPFVLIPRSPCVTGFSLTDLPNRPAPVFLIPSGLVTLGCKMVAGCSRLVPVSQRAPAPKQGSVGYNGCAWNAVSAFANCGRAVAHVRGSYGPTRDIRQSFVTCA